MVPLYKKLLGKTFEQLPEQLQLLHDLTTPQKWHGIAQVRRGTGLISRLIAVFLGLPKQADETPVTVTLTPQNRHESWVRNFGGKILPSEQFVGTGRYQGLLLERIGLMTIALELVVKDQRLYLIPRHWNLMGIPLPKILLPAGNTFEEQKDGVLRFNVEMNAPLVGLIVSYKGWLKQAP
ncbi:hypothetical protein MNBD_ALPHA08-2021 [hydrothermal vent metagenome]|uniref:DUF4166 domain-containing protein n=1 Tax=hydrothermal vent metagenome TaxID=652676 RepID=A0A3B0RV32_9ZZZZ